MHLVELFLQNVRGFQPKTRAVLAPGYCQLVPSDPDASLAALLTELLYPNGGSGPGASSAPFEASWKARLESLKGGKAGVVLAGDDGKTYRVIRVLCGGGALHRIDRATKTLEPLSDDVSLLGEVLASFAGLPPRASFVALNVLSPDRLPSRGGGGDPTPGQAGAAGAPAAPVAPTGGGIVPSEHHALLDATENGSEASEERLELLRRELHSAEAIEELQFELDGIDKELFDLQQQTSAIDGLRAELEVAEAEFERAPDAASMGLPIDILSRIDRLPAMATRRDEALKRLDAEQERLEGAVTPEPLTQQPLFWAGLVLGTAALVAGAMLEATLRYIALLDLPAFGLSALMAFRYVLDLERSEELTNQAQSLEARIKRVQEEYERHTNAVTRAMDESGVESTDELRRVLDKKDELANRAEEAHRRLSEAETDPAFLEVARKQETLSARRAEIDAELATHGFVRAPVDVRRELDKVAATLEARRTGASRPGGVGAGAMGGGSGGPVGDPAPALLRALMAVSGMDVPTAAQALQGRVGQYLAALSDRRYPGAQLGVDGSACAVSPDGAVVPLAGLPGPDADLLYLALWLTCAERLSAQRSGVFLVEGMAGLPESKAPLLAKMLAHLGKQAQVLHLTADPAFAKVATTRAEL